MKHTSGAGLPERDLDAALHTARRFIDPVLQDQATGTWNHAALRWGRSETTP
jgi:hypothetical protein